MVKICPCKDCKPPKRQLNCHSVCDDFRNWRKEKDTENMMIKDMKQKEKNLNSDKYRVKRPKKR